MDTWEWIILIGLVILATGTGTAIVNTITTAVTTAAGTVFGETLSAAQIATFAANAGFSGNDLITAVAIALAESSGNPSAHGDLNLGQGSFGLWQIYSTKHPEFGPDFTLLYDPQTNANAAFQIYQKAGGFSPWTTYNSGAYLTYMPTVQNALTA